MSAAPVEILFVIGSLRMGGAERHLADVARGLVRLGWKVTVYSLIESGPLHGEMEAAGISVILSPVEAPKKSWSRFRRLCRTFFAAVHLLIAIRRHRPKIVHLYLPLAYFLGAPLAILAGTPIRIMSRLSLNTYQKTSWPYRKLEPIFHRSMNVIIGNSVSILKQLNGDEGVPKSRLALVYSGIDYRPFVSADFCAETRSRLGIELDEIVFVIVANLISYKGHRDLLEALAIVNKSFSDKWRLLVAGRDDGIGTTLREQARENNIDDRIIWLGAVTDVEKILSASNIGILCSHQEGFSLALLEAMASGLPVVATDVGGNPEAVVQGVTGFIVPPGNPAELAKAIVALATNRDLRQKFGSAGKRRVIENFSLDQSIMKYDELYRKQLIEFGQ